MKRKEIVVCLLSLTVALTFFLVPVTYAHEPVAPFWYGTVDAYIHPQNPIIDPTLPYNPNAFPQNTMKCVGSVPSLAMNLQVNLMPIFMFNNNPQNQGGLIFNNSQKSWDGYTLLSCMNGCTHPEQGTTEFLALLVDNDGHFVHGWQNILGFPARMWPGGYITGSRDYGAPDSPTLVKQDWCGNEIWHWNSSDFGIMTVNDDPPKPARIQFHHDYQLQGNPVGYYAPPLDAENTFIPKTDGKVLALAEHVPEEAYSYPRGWPPEGHPARDTSNISQFPLLDDSIYIFHKRQKINFQWFACDHFEQMGFSDDAKYGIMNTRPLVFPPPRTDWTHFNNVNWLGPNKWYNAGDQLFHPDNIIFDGRNNNIIGIIAYDDYAGFKKGDIIWKVGPDYGPGTPWESLGYIVGPHQAHIIPATLPGAGNILVMDNGGMSGYGALREDCSGTWPNALKDYSRVLEFNPKTYEVVWEYTQTNPTADLDGDGIIKGNERKFFTAFMGSAQRLANGNTLITESNSGRVFEVTKEKEVVWEYIARTTSSGMPEQVGAAVYRAYKVPKKWVPSGVTCPQ